MARAQPRCLQCGKGDELDYDVSDVETNCPNCGTLLDWTCGECDYGFLDHKQNYCDGCGEELEWE